MGCEGLRNDGDAAAAERPLRAATNLLGKKWHPVVVTALLQDGPLGFNALKGQLDGVSDKVLSECLDELEEAGLVERDVIDEKPVRVEYSLTAAGLDLGPVIDDLEVWARKHLLD